MCLTKEEKKLLIEAVLWYTNVREDFAQALAQDNYRKRDGTRPTKDDVTKAFNYIDRLRDIHCKLSNME